MADVAQGVSAYLTAVQRLQKEVVENQMEVLSEVAGRMVEAVKQDRRIFLFGTGHSHMISEEGHYRAGGLACVVPILYPGLMVHESAQLGTQLERLPGVAPILLERYNPQPEELLFIFSASGVNALPIEMALTAKERGLTVLGVTNVAYCKVAPLSPLGKRMIEIADLTIDAGGIPGDTLIPVPGARLRVGPVSTVMYATLWQCLVTETAFRLQAEGLELPLYLSSNLPGAAEHNYKLLRIWSKRNPHL